MRRETPPPDPDDHGWRGSGRFRVARVDGRLVLRFGRLSTRGGSLEKAIGGFFRKDYRGVKPDYAPYAVDIWIEGDGLADKRLDVDNVAKACLDALTGILWRDDRQVVRLRVEKVQAETEAITLAAGPADPPGPAADLTRILEAAERLDGRRDPSDPA